MLNNAGVGVLEGSKLPMLFFAALAVALLFTVVATCLIMKALHTPCIRPACACACVSALHTHHLHRIVVIKACRAAATRTLSVEHSRVPARRTDAPGCYPHGGHRGMSPPLAWQLATPCVLPIARSPTRPYTKGVPPQVRRVVKQRDRIPPQNDECENCVCSYLCAPPPPPHPPPSIFPPPPSASIPHPAS